MYVEQLQEKLRVTDSHWEEVYNAALSDTINFYAVGEDKEVLERIAYNMLQAVEKRV